MDNYIEHMANTDIETTLYNGRHKVIFKNGSHRYYINGKAVQGVTTVLGKVLAKPGLMLWPLNMAIRHLTDKMGSGEHVLIGRDDLEDARNAHIKRRDAGADTGTIVHSLVEAMLATGNMSRFYPLESEEVRNAARGFQNWHDAVSPKTIAVEQLVYSEQENFAGTFDSILQIGDKNYLCDLKTTNASRDAPKGVYADYFIQLGAYFFAYEEQRKYEMLNGGTSLAGIDDLMILSCRKDGSVDVVSASELGLTPEGCANLWLCTISLHRGLTGLKDRLGIK